MQLQEHAAAEKLDGLHDLVYITDSGVHDPHVIPAPVVDRLQSEAIVSLLT